MQVPGKWGIKIGFTLQLPGYWLATAAHGRPLACNTIIGASNPCMCFLLQSLPTALEEAEHLERAAAMLETHCNTRTDQTLFCPSSSEAQVATSLTPLRKKLHQRDQPPSPRKRPQLEIDFVRKNSLRKRPRSTARWWTQFCCKRTWLDRKHRSWAISDSRNPILTFVLLYTVTRNGFFL